MDMEEGKKKINKFEIIDSRKFGENIREQRAKMKITRDDFASLSGLSVDYIGKIERGTDIPSLAVAIIISNTLNTPIDYLLTGKEKENKSINLLKLEQIISKASESEIEYFVKLLELRSEYENRK